MFQSLDHFEIGEIEVLVDITQSTFNIAKLDIARIIWRSLATNPIDRFRSQASYIVKLTIINKSYHTNQILLIRKRANFFALTTANMPAYRCHKN